MVVILKFAVAFLASYIFAYLAFGLFFEWLLRKI